MWSIAWKDPLTEHSFTIVQNNRYNFTYNVWLKPEFQRSPPPMPWSYMRDLDSISFSAVSTFRRHWPSHHRVRRNCFVSCIPQGSSNRSTEWEKNNIGLIQQSSANRVYAVFLCLLRRKKEGRIAPNLLDFPAEESYNPNAPGGRQICCNPREHFHTTTCLTITVSGGRGNSGEKSAGEQVFRSGKGQMVFMHM